MGGFQVPHAGGDGAGVARETLDGFDLRTQDRSGAVIFAEVGEGQLLGLTASQPRMRIEISGPGGRRVGMEWREEGRRRSVRGSTYDDVHLWLSSTTPLEHHVAPHVLEPS